MKKSTRFNKINLALFATILLKFLLIFFLNNIFLFALRYFLQRLGLHQYIYQDFWEKLIPVVTCTVLVYWFLLRKPLPFKGSPNQGKFWFFKAVLLTSIIFPTIYTQSMYYWWDSKNPHNHFLKIQHFKINPQTLSTIANFQYSGSKRQFLKIQLTHTLSMQIQDILPNDQSAQFAHFDYWAIFQIDVPADIKWDQQKLDETINQSIVDFKDKFLPYYNSKNVHYFEKIESSHKKIFIEDFIDQTYLLSKRGNNIFLIPKLESFEHDLDQEEQTLFRSIFFFSLLLNLTLAIFIFFNSSEHKINLAAFEKKLMKRLIPSKGQIMSALILDINLLFFLLGLFFELDLVEPSGKLLLNLGALTRESIVIDKEYWRLISSLFIHAGVFHLFFNMVSLIISAEFLEQKLKWPAFLVIYFSSGIAGNLVSLYFHHDALMMGASGAIFGLWGANIVLSSKNLFKEENKERLTFFATYVLYNLAWGFFSNLMNKGNSSIDVWSHIGGIAMGSILAFVLKK